MFYVSLICISLYQVDRKKTNKKTPKNTKPSKNIVKNILKLKRDVHLHLLKWILFNEAKLGSTRDSDVT